MVSLSEVETLVSKRKNVSLNQRFKVRIQGLDAVRDFEKGLITNPEAFTKRQCPICNKNSAIEIGQVDVMPIQECSGCGMKFCGLMSAGKFDLSYADDRWRKHKSNNVGAEVNFGSYIKSLRTELRGLVDFDKPLRFLDFGCGSGDFIGAARELNWEPYGLDINADLRKNVEERYGIPIYSDIDDIESNIKFDVVWMSYVACLLPDPIRTFKEINKHLSEKGILIISDINYDGYCVRKNGLDHYYYALPQVNFWSRDSLALALKSSGFSNILKFTERKFSPFNLLDGMHFRHKYFHPVSLKLCSRSKTATLVRSVVTTYLFRKAFGVLWRILKLVSFGRVTNIGFGNSITVAARK